MLEKFKKVFCNIITHIIAIMIVELLKALL